MLNISLQITTRHKKAKSIYTNPTRGANEQLHHHQAVLPITEPSIAQFANADARDSLYRTSDQSIISRRRTTPGTGLPSSCRLSFGCRRLSPARYAVTAPLGRAPGASTDAASSAPTGRCSSSCGPSTVGSNRIGGGDGARRPRRAPGLDYSSCGSSISWAWPDTLVK